MKNKHETVCFRPISHKYFRSFGVVPGLLIPVFLAGCLATAPTSGGRSATQVSGAAAGSSTTGANSSLEKCAKTLGTIRIEENTEAPWYGYYNREYRLGSTVPVLRTLVQQSNCFVVVERGERNMRNLDSERSLGRSDEARAGSNVGPGQVVSADYSLSPEIMMSNRGTERGGAGIGNILNRLPVLGPTLSSVAGTFSSNEAGTVLLLVDVRSRVQISAAEGYAKNVDLGLAGSIFAGGSAGSGGAYSSTPQGKVVLAAFIDSYNKMVVALRDYKPQTVKGGLGTGGGLGVQGGSTEASRQVPKK